MFCCNIVIFLNIKGCECFGLCYLLKLYSQGVCWVKWRNTGDYCSRTRRIFSGRTWQEWRSLESVPWRRTAVVYQIYQRRTYNEYNNSIGNNSNSFNEKSYLLLLQQHRPEVKPVRQRPLAQQLPSLIRLERQRCSPRWLTNRWLKTKIRAWKRNEVKFLKYFTEYFAISIDLNFSPLRLTNLQ